MADGADRRYRTPILLGCLAMIASGFLPWWHAGGESVNGVEIPPQTGIGLEGAGIVIFLAAILALIVLDIGYIRGRWGFILDAPWTYLVLGLLATGALAYRGWQLWRVGFLPLPQESPGLAVAAVGVALVLFGAGNGFGARPRG